MANRQQNARLSFDPQIKTRAFRRQAGMCALCGKDLSPRGKSWVAHHANGDRSDIRIGNCVLLCERPCHLNAHLGNWDGEYVLDHSEYPYRNAENF